MRYNLVLDGREGWAVAEDEFCPENVRKYESVMCQGNGYMGVRAVTEESYPRNAGQVLVAGTFDKAESAKTTELPNCADLLSAHIALDGEALDLSKGGYSDYLRALDLYTGLLRRAFTYKTETSGEVEFQFERFVSLVDKHLAGQRIRICPRSKPVRITISTGIDTRRYGDVHFGKASSKSSKNLIQYSETTLQSGIEFIYTAAVNLTAPDNITAASTLLESADGLSFQYDLTIEPGHEAIIEKMIRITTTRDLESAGKTPEELRGIEWRKAECFNVGDYSRYFIDSAEAWAGLWETCDVQIQSENPFDQLATRFAVYHLTIMAPAHDSRMNIGAKGLSGKGYHGHTFWDTEIYMLPYFIHMSPKTARSLLEYRYLCLEAARRKASENGYAGAMYPWEAAWLDDAETCPDLKFAQYEHHVTACVSYGVHYYYEATGDLEFMLDFGCEILFETAAFWRSRLEFNNERRRYEITNVIGPDEFTLNADNNAFTNYMAHFNIRLAIRWYDYLMSEHPEKLKALREQLMLEEEYPEWLRCAENLHLPLPTQEDILPQDDTYMSLEEIDLTPYRTGLRKLRRDYPYPHYSALKVSKQADVMVLFLLLEENFPKLVKKRSFYYYEPLCVHESSLSLCAYSLLAADVGESQEAYALYKQACSIDLGKKMDSSNDGIHAASLGGIWQCAVFGFLGIRLYDRNLRISPKLPDEWRKVSAKTWWRGQLLSITANHSHLMVEVLSGSNPVSLSTPCGFITFDGKLILKYKTEERVHE